MGQYFLTVNGEIPDFSKTEIAVAKVASGSTAMSPIRGGFTELNFSKKVDGRNNQYGNAFETVGQNQGNLGFTADVTVFEPAWKKLIKYFGSAYMDVTNQILVTAAYTIDGVSHKVSIKASIGEDSAGWSQGKVHTRKVTLHPVQILEDDEDGNEINPAEALLTTQ